MEVLVKTLESGQKNRLLENRQLIAKCEKEATVRDLKAIIASQLAFVGNFYLIHRGIILKEEDLKLKTLELTQENYVVAMMRGFAPGGGAAPSSSKRMATFDITVKNYQHSIVLHNCQASDTVASIKDRALENENDRLKFTYGFLSSVRKPMLALNHRFLDDEDKTLSEYNIYQACSLEVYNVVLQE